MRFINVIYIICFTLISFCSYSQKREDVYGYPLLSFKDNCKDTIRIFNDTLIVKTECKNNYQIINVFHNNILREKIIVYDDFLLEYYYDMKGKKKITSYYKNKLHGFQMTVSSEGDIIQIENYKN